MKAIALNIARSPYKGSSVVEAIDSALVAAVFESDVSLIFRGEGVFCLITEQDARSLGLKTMSKVLSALETYDIQKVYACSSSLAQYNLSEDDLIHGVTPLSDSAVADLLQSQNAVIGI